MGNIRWSVLLLSILTVCGISGCGVAKKTVSDTESVKMEADPVSVHGQLSFENGQLLDCKKEAYQLRGVSTHGIAWFPEYVNANSFKSVKEAGGNVVRIAAYTEGVSCYIEDPQKTMTLLYQAIENAKALGLYVIIDWHILEDGDPTIHQREAITFFDAIASRYGDDPSIIYEICNEPNKVGWDTIQQYAYAMFPVIRQYAPHALILLGVPDYSYNLQYPITKPFPEENFAYTFHYYAGEHPDYGYLKLALEQGLPVFVTEWGMGYGSDGIVDLADGKEFLSFLNEKGISWCAWSLCNKDEVYSLLKPDCTRFGGWEQEDLTDVGALIFQGLKGEK